MTQGEHDIIEWHQLELCGNWLGKHGLVPRCRCRKVSGTTDTRQSMKRRIATER